jgi:hypothetical protein
MFVLKRITQTALAIVLAVVVLEHGPGLVDNLPSLFSGAVTVGLWIGRAAVLGVLVWSWSLLSGGSSSVAHLGGGGSLTRARAGTEDF